MLVIGHRNAKRGQVNTVDGLLSTLPDIQKRLLKSEEVQQYQEEKERVRATATPGIHDYNEFNVVCAYNSAKLEGCRLSLHDSKRYAALLSANPNVDYRTLASRLNLPEGDCAMLHGILDAMEYEMMYSRWSPVSESMIREMHYLVLQDAESQYRGAYRPLGYEVAIGGSGVKTSPSNLVPAHMRELLSSKYKTGVDIVDAVSFHALFETIHPFVDGNGRTGRLLLNHMLPLPCIITPESGYFAALGDFSWNPEHLLRLVVRSALRVQRSF